MLKCKKKILTILETPILPLNQTKKKRKRPRRSIGVTKKG